MAFVFISHIPLMPHNESAVSKKKKKNSYFLHKLLPRQESPRIRNSVQNLTMSLVGFHAVQVLLHLASFID